MFRKITAAVLFSEDIDRLMRFYRDSVGLEVAFHDDTSYAFKMEDQDFAVVSMASAVEMLNEDVVKAVGHRVMLCTRVDDVDAAYEKLVANGVTIIKPPTNQHWGLRTVFFADPDGNIWELAQPIEEHSSAPTPISP